MHPEADAKVKRCGAYQALEADLAAFEAMEEGCGFVAGNQAQKPISWN
jgi:hypothetical protein